MPTYPNVKVVGMHFRGAHAKEIASALLPGNTLTLEREPENQFDINAIKVIHPGTEQHIGYVEASQAAWTASELDETSEPPTCTVTGLETANRNTYPVVTIVVDETAPVPDPVPDND